MRKFLGMSIPASNVEWLDLVPPFDDSFMFVGEEWDYPFDSRSSCNLDFVGEMGCGPAGILFPGPAGEKKDRRYAPDPCEDTAPFLNNKGKRFIILRLKSSSSSAQYLASTFQPKPQIYDDLKSCKPDPPKLEFEKTGYHLKTTSVEFKTLKA
jgi:hypothetical protein